MAKMRLNGIVLVGILAMFVNGCSIVKTKRHAIPPSGDSKALSILAELTHRNRGIKTVKGKGNIRIWNEHGTQTARVVWASQIPDKIRLEVLDPFGRPDLSIAFNGQTLYVVSRSENKYRKLTRSNLDLKELAAIPIRFKEIIALICGKLPLGDYQSVRQDRHMVHPMLKLVDEDAAPVTFLYMDSTETEPLELVSYKSNGNIRYRVKLGNTKQVGPYRFWDQVTVTDATQTSGFHLAIQQCWPNTEVSSDTFQLARPR